MPTQVIPQAAAIAVRDGLVCLVTSSRTRRWTLPKGTIEAGQTAEECVRQESWEEAGLFGALQPEPLGWYEGDKLGRPTAVAVFLLHVTEVSDDWPERAIRRRHWVTPKKALTVLAVAGQREVLRAAIDDGRLRTAFLPSQTTARP